MILHDVFGTALLIRAVEKQLLEGYKQRSFGGTVHTCIGQEVLPAYLAHVLNNDPIVFSNHRGHGHFIAHVQDYKLLFREFLGKVNAPASGIGGSQHLHADNFLSNGIQGNTSPFAVGAGFSRPAVIYLGDGTFGEGVLYEAFNLAKLTKSRILFVVEDNQISQTTPSHNVLAGDFSSKFSAFDIHCLEVDSADMDSLEKVVLSIPDEWNEHRVLGVIVRSYRLGAHSKGDDTRSMEIVDKLPDPLRIMAKALKLDYELEMSILQEKILSDWMAVVEEADQKMMQQKSRFSIDLKSIGWGKIEKDNSRINEHIRSAIDVALDKGGLFVGEDIVTCWNKGDRPYGGAFGVAYGLSDKHEKVIGTSISEAGICGFSAGHAYVSGHLSIAEIMFADFSTLIVDQMVNGVDKFLKMYGKIVPIPLVVRLPYGMGRGYGPTHSQSPFELFSVLTEVIVLRNI